MPRSKGTVHNRSSGIPSDWKSLSASSDVDSPSGLGRRGSPVNSGGRSSDGTTSPSTSCMWLCRILYCGEGGGYSGDRLGPGAVPV